MSSGSRKGKIWTWCRLRYAAEVSSPTDIPMCLIIVIMCDLLFHISFPALNGIAMARMRKNAMHENRS